MKIALISDIHGNLPALEAVLEDIHERKADKIVCLGDLIGKGPSTKEIIDLCRNYCDYVVQGNWDLGLYEAYYALNHKTDQEITDRSLWYIKDAGDQRMEYLGTLPHGMELYLSGKLTRLFHAHPVNFNRYYADSPLEQRMELFQYGEASEIRRQSDVAIYADIHSAYMQIIDKRMLINVGSVGNPLDITQASYVMLEGEESEEISSFGMEFLRVPYEIERAVSMAAKRGIPDLQGYISELRSAIYYKRG